MCSPDWKYHHRNIIIAALVAGIYSLSLTWNSKLFENEERINKPCIFDPCKKAA